MDLETRNINGILHPYCVSFYCIDSDNKERAQSFYLADYNSSDAQLKAALKSLMEDKYNGYIVYLHNLSNFEGIFLIRILAELSSKIKPIIRENRIINLSVKYGYKNKCTIKFRDSYLLLPCSLADLGKDFALILIKEFFHINLLTILN